MTIDNIKTKLIEVIKEDIDEIPEDTSVDLQEAGILDSLVVMNLISYIEDDLHIQFLPEHITKSNFKSIDSIANLIIGYMK